MLSLSLVLLLAPQDVPAPAVPAEPVKAKKICRAAEETGTRLARKKICKTAEEWRKANRETGDITSGIAKPVTVPAE